MVRVFGGVHKDASDHLESFCSKLLGGTILQYLVQNFVILFVPPLTSRLCHFGHLTTKWYYFQE